MSKTVTPAPISPIYWERHGNQDAKVIDLRTLPEDFKVAILQAAIEAVQHWDEGDIEVPELSDAEVVMKMLSTAVAGIKQHMHQTMLVPSWEVNQ